jgi:uncharacterized membrane protein YqaE (UPF0057 family)
MPWPQHHAHARRFSRHDLLPALTFILPPLAVRMAGDKRAVFANFLLTLCGWVPGIIHARRVVARLGRHDFSADQLVNALAHHVRR